MLQPTYLRRKQAATYLQERYGAYTTETLAKLATIGGGPSFRKLGRFPLYTKEDLTTWAESRMSKSVKSTSELTLERE
ncbi:MAG: hypothetical protein COB24_13890 [Hyphomicrobiales bacterium]|nr:MAG: hypothetical protein COB24_13890 [Hyphomicrobiales bacterium]